MTQESTQRPNVDQGFEERWAAWQARGVAHDRAMRRKLFVVAAIVVLGATILSGVWLLLPAFRPI